MSSELQKQENQKIRQIYSQVKKEVSKVIVGQDALIRHLFISMLCEGHCLIEGVPGLGKTLLVQTFSKVLSLDYSRIQFTPDLMPADILGTQIVSGAARDGGQFRFYKGPVFGQMILADEINRATPKTQSALLEAMQESHVTLFGEKHVLPRPFVVLATQNPLEMEGTYPLPEAQVDRFLFKLQMDYPDESQLGQILDKTFQAADVDIKNPLDAQGILELIPQILEVPMASHVREFAIRVLTATHPNHENASKDVKTYVRYGASPRGLQAMARAAKARALLEGRVHVSTEDIKALAAPALRHRIILNLKGIAEGIDPDEIINGIIVSNE